MSAGRAASIASDPRRSTERGVFQCLHLTTNAVIKGSSKPMALMDKRSAGMRSPRSEPESDACRLGNLLKIDNVRTNNERYSARLSGIG